MEGGRPKRFNDLSQESEFDSASYDQLNQINGDYKEPPRSKKEKLNTVIIVTVGILALFFGIYEMAYGIMNPFSFIKDNAGQNATTTIANSADLKNIDTDGDGLNDYDEVNAYHTSPYLEDTDGDGILDGQEVKNGTDPNCPQGQQCATGYNFGASASGTAPVFGVLPSVSSPAVDAATLRQLLVQDGMAKADVDQMTDAEIMQLYQQALADNPDLANQATQAGISLPPTSSTTGSSGQTFTVPGTIDTSDLKVTSLDDMKNLSGAQIKALMIKNGASADLLNQVSDDEIKQMLLEKLKTNSN